MPDTGEKRELKQRVNAHQAEEVRESRKLIQKAKEPSVRNKTRSRGRHPLTKSRD
jgi:hypothetical protein